VIFLYRGPIVATLCCILIVYLFPTEFIVLQIPYYHISTSVLSEFQHISSMVLNMFDVWLSLNGMI
jgi:hypothetical protein